MTIKRRIDIHIDFQFKRGAKPKDDPGGSDLLEEIAAEVARRIAKRPDIKLLGVTWERRDDEAGEPLREIGPMT